MPPSQLTYSNRLRAIQRGDHAAIRAYVVRTQRPSQHNYSVTEIPIEVHSLSAAAAYFATARPRPCPD